MSTPTERTIAADVVIGDRIRFVPGEARRWWTVRDRDDRFIVCTMRNPFKPKDTWYTVVDLTGWQDRRYNGAGNGVVRSSLNTIGGGWDIDSDEDCRTIIPALRSGRWELSHRRIVSVESIERGNPSPAGPEGR